MYSHTFASLGDIERRAFAVQKELDHQLLIVHEIRERLAPLQMKYLDMAFASSPEVANWHRTDPMTMTSEQLAVAVHAYFPWHSFTFIPPFLHSTVLDASIGRECLTEYQRNVLLKWYCPTCRCMVPMSGVHACPSAAAPAATAFPSLPSSSSSSPTLQRAFDPSVVPPSFSSSCSSSSSTSSSSSSCSSSSASQSYASVASGVLAANGILHPSLGADSMPLLQYPSGLPSSSTFTCSSLSSLPRMDSVSTPVPSMGAVPSSAPGKRTATISVHRMSTLSPSAPRRGRPPLHPMRRKQEPSASAMGAQLPDSPDARLPVGPNAEPVPATAEPLLPPPPYQVFDPIPLVPNPTTMRGPPGVQTTAVFSVPLPVGVGGSQKPESAVNSSVRTFTPASSSSSSSSSKSVASDSHAHHNHQVRKRLYRNKKGQQKSGGTAKSAPATTPSVI